MTSEHHEPDGAPDGGAGEATRARAPWRRWCEPWAALALWGPFVLPLFGEHLSRDNECRANWLDMLPVMPGFAPVHLFRALTDGPPKDQVVQRLLMGALALVLLVAVSRWAARHRKSALIVTAVYALLSAGFLDALFAM